MASTAASVGMTRRAPLAIPAASLRSAGAQPALKCCAQAGARTRAEPACGSSSSIRLPSQDRWCSAQRAESATAHIDPIRRRRAGAGAPANCFGAPSTRKDEELSVGGRQRSEKRQHLRKAASAARTHVLQSSSGSPLSLPAPSALPPVRAMSRNLSAAPALHVDRRRAARAAAGLAVARVKESLACTCPPPTSCSSAACSSWSP